MNNEPLKIPTLQLIDNIEACRRHRVEYHAIMGECPFCAAERERKEKAARVSVNCRIYDGGEYSQPHAGEYNTPADDAAEAETESGFWFGARGDRGGKYLTLVCILVLLYVFLVEGR